VIVVSVFAALQVSISYISFRSRHLRPILQGEPIVLVQDGSLIESNLRRERLTAGEVAEAARQEQIASLEDVQWAVLETSGKISFIPKSSS
jgi:uncharacterized membrane protein YcaP (DUF421 family)